MKQKLITLAAVSGAISVILGALGAHQLKNMLSASSLDAFDKGVRYQMYHSLLLLFLALSVNNQNLKIVRRISGFIITGISLFSFSIYLLSTQSISHLNVTFLGPVTPIGGLCMIIGWALLALNANKIYEN